MSGFPKRLVVKIWQDKLLDRTDLVTEEGEPIKVIYPGRINDDQGADLLDAVVAAHQELIKGDVEVHVKSSDWWAHRHHQNQVYNRVVLHVVFWCDTDTAINLQNGDIVPTLTLSKFIENPSARHINSLYPVSNSGMPCRQTAERLSIDFIGEFLESAGEDRFLVKAARFQADLARIDANQCLYEGIMEALGYNKNKLPFIELARRLPLQFLESMTQDKISGNECLACQQALLLGTAGLLPSQCSNRYRAITDNEWIGKLEKLWASTRQTEVMSENNWHLFKVRPANLPTRRIAAISHLLCRCRERGILREVIARIGGDAGCRELEKLLLNDNLGYTRAADIVVNVLLPFAYAWSKLNSQPELARKAFDLYHHHPRLSPNTVERHMRRQLGLYGNLVNSAQRQQGLLHVYKTLCTQGRCDSCLLKQAPLLVYGR